MNPWCQVLDIDVPSLETVRDHRAANTYAKLIVALLERGEPMTLAAVADRFEAAGVAPAPFALRSLKRCRPARAPVYRDGDQYGLDPHDDELDFWAFRLGLRPPRVPHLRIVPPEPEPLPGPEVPLTRAEIEEAFGDAHLSAWSAQRLALAVLDAHGGRLSAARTVGALNRLTSRYHTLQLESAPYWRSGAIVVSGSGAWEVNPDHPALVAARRAVRERLEAERRRKATHPTPAVMEASSRRRQADREARAKELAGLRRVLVVGFPPDRPQALTLLDVTDRELVTFVGEELGAVPARLAEYDLICGLHVRGLLASLGIRHESLHLADLGPPQKTMRLNRRGRTLKITTAMLIQGSCAVSRPFGDRAVMKRYLAEGRTGRLERRLESDAKSVFALYQYGRLHGSVRLRWGFLDEMLRVPWVHMEEPKFRNLARQALEADAVLDVVVGQAPGWADPWSRVRRCRVDSRPGGWRTDLMGDDGFYIDEWDVQLARLPARAQAR